LVAYHLQPTLQKNKDIISSSDSESSRSSSKVSIKDEDEKEDTTRDIIHKMQSELNLMETLAKDID
jgi:hypothetical protein